MSTPARFCANCGASAAGASTHCERCGKPLAPATSGAEASGGAVPAAGGVDAAPRSPVPAIVIGLVACGAGGFFFLICGGILAAIAIPNFLHAQARSKSMSASTNIEALWRAEQAHAAANDGEFLEFYVGEEDLTDENYLRLGVRLDRMHHSYEGFHDGESFVITASGNIDEDEDIDEWEMGEDDASPVHTSNDLLNTLGGPVAMREHGGEAHSHSEEEEEEEEGETEGEPVVADDAVGGLATPGGGGDVDAKGATARMNLNAIWEGQQAYRIRTKQYLPFTDGGAGTWESLGLNGLPAGKHHVYSATGSAKSVTITATGNLDADTFVDEWTLSSDDGIAIQVKNDALDLDLSELANVLRDIAKKKEASE